jgi:hypothetical protein
LAWKNKGGDILKGSCLELAEKIVSRLILKGYQIQKIPKDGVFDPKEQIELLSDILGFTYGETTSVTFRNQKGEIVAKLWIKPDGTLADDSWLCPLGWK